MARISIIGSTGAGKTKLALALGNVLDHPVHHLDYHFHGRGYSAMSLDMWKSFVGDIAEHEEWVMDGNYFDTLEDRINRTTHMIWLDPPWVISFPRSLIRTLANRGRTRADLGMVERVNFSYVAKLLTYKMRRAKDISAAYDIAQRRSVNCIRIGSTTNAQDLQRTFLS
jgi:adenylate kinase family enzyme